MPDRKWVPTFGELIDRLSILQIKECKILEHKKEYAKEIENILHDLKSIIEEENLIINAELIRAIVVLSQMNLHIWVNEEKCRNGNKDGNNLELSHSLNGIRCTAKNKIQSTLNLGRLDKKIDYISEDFCGWQVSWIDISSST